MKVEESHVKLTQEERRGENKNSKKKYTRKREYTIGYMVLIEQMKVYSTKNNK